MFYKNIITANELAVSSLHTEEIEATALAERSIKFYYCFSPPDNLKRRNMQEKVKCTD